MAKEKTTNAESAEMMRQIAADAERFDTATDEEKKLMMKGAMNMAKEMAQDLKKKILAGNKDFADLEAKLEGLTGDDLEECEKEEVIAGNKSANVAGSRTFLIRLAAKALNVPLADLKQLPMRQYLQLVRRTDLFFADILELQVPSLNTENLQ